MKTYKPVGPNPKRPNAPIGRHERTSYGVSDKTSTTPQTKNMRSSSGKSVSVRSRSRKEA